MAKRRALSLDIISDKRFMSLPCTAQLLYFQLCMQADDEGFLSMATVKDTEKRARLTEADFDALLEADWVMCFPVGACAIRHWFVHNSPEVGAFDEEGFTPTKYKFERSLLDVDENGVYVDHT